MLLLDVVVLAMSLGSVVSKQHNHLNPCRVLGIKPHSSHAEIKNAYKRLALKYHPDKNPDPNSQELFNEIGAARDMLMDGQQRFKWEKCRDRPQYDYVQLNRQRGHTFRWNANEEWLRSEYFRQRRERRRKKSQQPLVFPNHIVEIILLVVSWIALDFVVLLSRNNVYFPLILTLMVFLIELILLPFIFVTYVSYAATLPHMAKVKKLGPCFQSNTVMSELYHSRTMAWQENWFSRQFLLMMQLSLYLRIPRRKNKCMKEEDERNPDKRKRETSPEFDKVDLYLYYKQSHR
ncbi:hypothetical protein BSKO_02390 [Bryopsis sp. KO-2023]|nr:hypothetical protein BSKO_02390 [Bryopsis sp. KO-2023]